MRKAMRWSKELFRRTIGHADVGRSTMVRSPEWVLLRDDQKIPLGMGRRGGARAAIIAIARSVHFHGKKGYEPRTQIAALQTVHRRQRANTTGSDFLVLRFASSADRSSTSDVNEAQKSG